MEKKFKVTCRVSIPHYHPGPDDDCSQFTKKRDLAQKDHWVTNEKKSIPELGGQEFTVVMPPRSYSFVELTVTAWHKLMKGKPFVFNEGPIQIKLRHFHCDVATGQKMGLKDGDHVSIEKKNGIRPGRLDNVLVRVDKWSVPEIHLDTDEANALLITDGEEIDLIIPLAPGV